MLTILHILGVFSALGGQFVLIFFARARPIIVIIGIIGKYRYIGSEIPDRYLYWYWYWYRPRLKF